MYNVPAAIRMSDASAALAAGAAALDAGESEFSLAQLRGSDSSALAVLLSWERHAKAAGRPLRFVEVPPGLASIADLYGVGVLLAGFGEPGATS
jgi:phospholipid transport system transporter-binding protein